MPPTANRTPASGGTSHDDDDDVLFDIFDDRLAGRTPRRPASRLEAAPASERDLQEVLAETA